MARFIVIVMALVAVAVACTWLEYPLSYARLKLNGDSSDGRVEALDKKTVFHPKGRFGSSVEAEEVPCLTVSYKRAGKKYQLKSCAELLAGHNEGEGIPILVSRDDPAEAIIDNPELAIEHGFVCLAAFSILGLLWARKRRETA